MRRIAAETSAPDCRTMSCHAASPFELLPTCTLQRPAIDGTFASLAGTGAKRFAWNGYGVPRVPREYCPSSRPSLTVASSVVPYSSKLRASVPLVSVPVVDVTFSSPLKKDPLTAEPEPAISNRNGISSAPLFTVTVASHRPASGCAPARDGNVTSATTAASDKTDSLVFMATTPETQK